MKFLLTFQFLIAFGSEKKHFKSSNELYHHHQHSNGQSHHQHSNGYQNTCQYGANDDQCLRAASCANWGQDPYYTCNEPNLLQYCQPIPVGCPLEEQVFYNQFKHCCPAACAGQTAHTTPIQVVAGACGNDDTDNFASVISEAATTENFNINVIMKISNLAPDFECIQLTEIPLGIHDLRLSGTDTENCEEVLSNLSKWTKQQEMVKRDDVYVTDSIDPTQINSGLTSKQRVFRCIDYNLPFRFGDYLFKICAELSHPNVGTPLKIKAVYFGFFYSGVNFKRMGDEEEAVVEYFDVGRNFVNDLCTNPTKDMLGCPLGTGGNLQIAIDLNAFKQQNGNPPKCAEMRDGYFARSPDQQTYVVVIFIYGGSDVTGQLIIPLKTGFNSMLDSTDLQNIFVELANNIVFNEVITMTSQVSGPPVQCPDGTNTIQVDTNGCGGYCAKDCVDTYPSCNHMFCSGAQAMCKVTCNACDTCLNDEIEDPNYPFLCCKEDVHYKGQCTTCRDHHSSCSKYSDWCNCGIATQEAWMDANCPKTCDRCLSTTAVDPCVELGCGDHCMLNHDIGRCNKVNTCVIEASSTFDDITEDFCNECQNNGECEDDENCIKKEGRNVCTKTCTLDDDCQCLSPYHVCKPRSDVNEISKKVCVPNCKPLGGKDRHWNRGCCSGNPYRGHYITFLECEDAESLLLASLQYSDVDQMEVTLGDSTDAEMVFFSSLACQDKEHRSCVCTNPANCVDGTGVKICDGLKEGDCDTESNCEYMFEADKDCSISEQQCLNGYTCENDKCVQKCLCDHGTARDDICPKNAPYHCDSCDNNDSIFKKTFLNGEVRCVVAYDKAVRISGRCNQHIDSSGVSENCGAENCFHSYCTDLAPELAEELGHLNFYNDKCFKDTRLSSPVESNSCVEYITCYEGYKPFTPSYESAYHLNSLAEPSEHGDGYTVWQLPCVGEGKVQNLIIVQVGVPASSLFFIQNQSNQEHPCVTQGYTDVTLKTKDIFSLMAQNLFPEAGTVSFIFTDSYPSGLILIYDGQTPQLFFNGKDDSAYNGNDYVLLLCVESFNQSIDKPCSGTSTCAYGYVCDSTLTCKLAGSLTPCPDDSSAGDWCRCDQTVCSSQDRCDDKICITDCVALNKIDDLDNPGTCCDDNDDDGACDDVKCGEVTNSDGVIRVFNVDQMTAQFAETITISSVTVISGCAIEIKVQDGQTKSFFSFVKGLSLVAAEYICSCGTVFCTLNGDDCLTNEVCSNISPQTGFSLSNFVCRPACVALNKIDDLDNPGTCCDDNDDDGACDYVAFQGCINLCVDATNMDQCLFVSGPQKIEEYASMCLAECAQDKLHPCGDKCCTILEQGSCDTAPHPVDCVENDGMTTNTLDSDTNKCDCRGEFSGEFCDMANPFCDVCYGSGSGTCSPAPSDCEENDGITMNTLESDQTCTCSGEVCDMAKPFCDVCEGSGSGTCSPAPTCAQRDGKTSNNLEAGEECDCGDDNICNEDSQFCVDGLSCTENPVPDCATITTLSLNAKCQGATTAEGICELTGEDCTAVPDCAKITTLSLNAICQGATTAEGICVLTDEYCTLA